MYKAIALLVALFAALAAFAVAGDNSRGLNAAGCGKASLRIVGGSNSYKGQYPWMISLVYNNRYHICGATILDDYWVMSAAHCFGNTQNPRYYTVKAGAYNILTSESQTKSYSVKAITLHSGYSPTWLKNDIALLQLNSKIDFSSSYINRVCIPSKHPYNTDGKSAVIVGWGDMKNVTGTNMPAIQQTAKTTIQTESTCNTWWGIMYTHSQQVCALSSTTAVCSGDSGGPIHVTESDGTHIQVGISSFVSSSGCLSRYPNVFARVSYHLDWIKSKTGLSL